MNPWERQWQMDEGPWARDWSSAEGGLVDEPVAQPEKPGFLSRLFPANDGANLITRGLDAADSAAQAATANTGLLGNPFTAVPVLAGKASRELIGDASGLTRAFGRGVTDAASMGASATGAHAMSKRDLELNDVLFNELSLGEQRVAAGDEHARAATARNLRNLANVHLGSRGDRDERQIVLDLANAFERGEDVSDRMGEMFLGKDAERWTPPEEKAAYSVAKSIEEWGNRTFEQKEGEEGFVYDVVGSMPTLLMFMGVSSITGPAGSFTLAGLMGQQETYDRGRIAGLDPMQAAQRAHKGIPAGILQAFPAEMILGRIPGLKPSRELNTFWEALKRTGLAAGGEFSVENLGNIWQNLIDAEVNDKAQWSDNTPYAGLVSGTGAAAIQAAFIAAAKSTRGASLGMTRADFDAAMRAAAADVEQSIARVYEADYQASGPRSLGGILADLETATQSGDQGRTDALKSELKVKLGALAGQPQAEATPSPMRVLPVEEPEAPINDPERQARLRQNRILSELEAIAESGDTSPAAVARAEILRQELDNPDSAATRAHAQIGAVAEQVQQQGFLDIAPELAPPVETAIPRKPVFSENQQGFAPTHTLLDGTRVQATGQPDVYLRENGTQVIAGRAVPIVTSPVGAQQAPVVPIPPPITQSQPTAPVTPAPQAPVQAATPRPDGLIGSKKDNAPFSTPDAARMALRRKDLQGQLLEAVETEQGWFLAPIDTTRTDILESVAPVTMPFERPVLVQRHAEELRTHAPEAGWAEEGGRAIRNTEGEAVGRTNWVPLAEWFGADSFASDARIPDRNARAAAVEKAINGEPMSPTERRFVYSMIDVAQEYAEAEAEALRSLDAVDKLAAADPDANIPFDETHAQQESLSDQDIDAIFGLSPSAEEGGRSAQETAPAGAAESAQEVSRQEEARQARLKQNARKPLEKIKLPSQEFVVDGETVIVESANAAEALQAVDERISILERLQKCLA